MKTLLRWVVALGLLLTAGAASAQNLTGNWQGTLQAGARSLRILFVVSAADGGALRGVMYSIDQGPTGDEGHGVGHPRAAEADGGRRAADVRGGDDQTQ